MLRAYLIERGECNMKKKFEQPIIEIIRLQQENVITTSGGGLNKEDEFINGGADYDDLLG